MTQIVNAYVRAARGPVDATPRKVQVGAPAIPPGCRRILFATARRFVVLPTRVTPRRLVQASRCVPPRRRRFSANGKSAHDLRAPSWQASRNEGTSGPRTIRPDLVERSHAGDDQSDMHYTPNSRREQGIATRSAPRVIAQALRAASRLGFQMLPKNFPVRSSRKNRVPVNFP